jgi:hypothetical protein
MSAIQTVTLTNHITATSDVDGSIITITLTNESDKDANILVAAIYDASATGTPDYYSILQSVTVPKKDTTDGIATVNLAIPGSVTYNSSKLSVGLAYHS